MKMSHTKGKLVVATIDGGEVNDEIITNVNGCMVNICEVFGEGIYSEYRPKGEKEPHYKVSVDESKANAKRIVQCWNSHDELVEALENMMASFSAGLPGGVNPEWIVDYCAAKEVLKSAKGE